MVVGNDISVGGINNAAAFACRFIAAAEKAAH